MVKGKVYIVGAGPGDPDLITIKAMKCLIKADVVIYDRLVNPELLEHSDEAAERIYVGKEPGNHCVAQDVIQDLLIEKAMQGKTVVRLKGGDPFVFGRGGEEALALRESGIEFEVIPGITAGIAAPAYAGIPITHRELGRSFAIVTGHCLSGRPDSIKWDHLSHAVDTIAIYMGVKNLPYICERLITAGKDTNTPIAVIEQGTTMHQRTVTGTLNTIIEVVNENNIKNPAMIVIGEVVKLSSKLSWIEKEAMKSIL